MNHLTESDLEHYRQGHLSPAELERVDRHLGECTDCRELLLNRVQKAIPALLSQTGDPHLTYEELEAWVEDGLDASEGRRVQNHLARCAQCNAEADDLKAFAKEVNATRAATAARTSDTTVRKLQIIPRKPIGSWAWYGGAIAASILIAVWIASHRSPELVANAGIPNEYRELVNDSTRSGRVEIPAFIATMQQGTSTLRGNADSRTFQLKAPIATAVVSQQPTFEWNAFSRTARYVVGIFDDRQNKVAASPELRDTSWTPSEALARAHDYTWQVTAIDGSERVVAPAPDRPPARFRVVDTQTADTLQDAQRKYGTNRLLIGLLFARAGVLDRAEEELSRDSSAHPEGAAAKILQTLRQSRTGSAPR